MGAFHHNHGDNIRLREDRTVALRVSGYHMGVVFTELAIPLGGTFQVKLLDKGGGCGWASIVSQRRGRGRDYDEGRYYVYYRKPGISNWGEFQTLGLQSQFKQTKNHAQTVLVSEVTWR